MLPVLGFAKEDPVDLTDTRRFSISGTLAAYHCIKHVVTETEKCWKPGK